MRTVLFVGAFFIKFVHSLRYASTDPATTSLVNDYRPLDVSGGTGADAGKVHVIQDSGGVLGWAQVNCSDAVVLRQALEFDATRYGHPLYESSESKYGHGPCCINQHHYVCQIMLSEINKCDSMNTQESKFLPPATTITAFQISTGYDAAKGITTSAECSAQATEIETALRLLPSVGTVDVFATGADINSTDSVKDCQITKSGSESPYTYTLSFNIHASGGTQSVTYIGINTETSSGGTTSCPIDTGFVADRSCSGVETPTNGAIGDCNISLSSDISLLSGYYCQPTCDSGYTVSGKTSCYSGTLSQASCAESSCDASTALANANVGDCTASLGSPGTCYPLCYAGFTLTANSTCDKGTLTSGVCNRICSDTTTYYDGSACTAYATTSCGAEYTLTLGSAGAEDDSSCDLTCSATEYYNNGTCVAYAHTTSNCALVDGKTFTPGTSINSDDSDCVRKCLTTEFYNSGTQLCTVYANTAASCATANGYTLVLGSAYAADDSSCLSSCSITQYYNVSSCVAYAYTTVNCVAANGETLTTGTAHDSDNSACIVAHCNATALIDNADGVGTCIALLPHGSNCQQTCSTGMNLEVYHLVLTAF